MRVCVETGLGLEIGNIVQELFDCVTGIFIDISQRFKFCQFRFNGLHSSAKYVGCKIQCIRRLHIEVAFT